MQKNIALATTNNHEEIPVDQTFATSEQTHFQLQQCQQLIIGLSATAMSRDQHLAFRNGMDLFCSKPVDMPALGYGSETDVSFD